MAEQQPNYPGPCEWRPRAGLALPDPCDGQEDRYRGACDHAKIGVPWVMAWIVNRHEGPPPEPAQAADVPMPSLVRKAVNFAGAALGHVAAGRPMATPEQQAARLAICRANECGYYRQGDRCGHTGCGCYLTVKVSWEDQSCPLEPPVWGPVTATGGQER